jgi:hypothetical protein
MCGLGVIGHKLMKNDPSRFSDIFRRLRNPDLLGKRMSPFCPDVQVVNI